MGFVNLADVNIQKQITDTTNFLIENEGVIEKVDKDILIEYFGGHSEEYDLIIKWSPTSISVDRNIEDFSIMSGSYERALEKIVNVGEFPKIKIVVHYEQYDSEINRMKVFNSGEIYPIIDFLWESNCIVLWCSYGFYGENKVFHIGLDEEGFREIY